MPAGGWSDAHSIEANGRACQAPVRDAKSTALVLTWRASCDILSAVKAPEVRTTLNLPRHIDRTIDALAELLGTDRSSVMRLAVVELAERHGALVRPDGERRADSEVTP